MEVFIENLFYIALLLCKMNILNIFKIDDFDFKLNFRLGIYTLSIIDLWELWKFDIFFWCFKNQSRISNLIQLITNFSD